MNKKRFSQIKTCFFACLDNYSVSDSNSDFSSNSMSDSNSDCGYDSDSNSAFIKLVIFVFFILHLRSSK